MKEIPDWPGYFADEGGNIYSIHIGSTTNKVLPVPRKLKIKRIGDRYLTIRLCRDGIIRTQSVHDLILRTFVGDPPPGRVCCHGAGGKFDNSIRNLRWGTPSENQMDRVRDGTDCRGEKHPFAKLTAEEVVKIRSLRGVLKQNEIAKMFGICKVTVCDIQTGRRWAWLKEKGA